MAWNPAKYMRFGGARLRPALDLLAQAQAAAIGRTVKHVVDLGCGPGNLTRFLAAAWPEATVVGVDSSAEMLRAGEAAARDAGVTNVSFMQGTIEDFSLPGGSTTDVLYSNAALHWVPHHDKLLPQLLESVAPGGVFAAQIPDTRVQPSHLLMETAAANLGWEGDVADARIPRCEEDPDFYLKVLAPQCGGAEGVNLWATEYVQVLEGFDRDVAGASEGAVHPVAAYTRQTGLKPLLAALGGEGSERANAFELEYQRLIAEAYPSTSEFTVFPFKRFFMVATRASGHSE